MAQYGQQLNKLHFKYTQEISVAWGEDRHDHSLHFANMAAFCVVSVHTVVGLGVEDGGNFLKE